MFLDINKIGPEGVSIDEPLELPDLEDPAKQRIEMLRARIRGEARPGPRGVSLKARLDADARMTCSRCLEPFVESIGREFWLILVPDAVELASGKEEVGDDDVALFYAREGKANTEEIATEQIYLNLPLKPVCRPDCRGLCPECGTNRNEGDCSCETEEIDPRLTPLLKFKIPRRDS